MQKGLITIVFYGVLIKMKNVNILDNYMLEDKDVL